MRKTTARLRVVTVFLCIAGIMAGRAALCVAALPPPLRPVATAPMMAGAPVEDGRMRDGEYAHASSLAPFRVLQNGNLAKTQTTAYVAFDETCLYIAWAAGYSGTQPAATAQDRDGPVWNDDAIEIMFRIPEAGGRMVHFIGNAKSVFYDESGPEGEKWNGDWRYRAGIENGRWIGEAAIPFTSLGLPGAPKDGASWPFDIGHTSPGSGELSVWSWQPGRQGYVAPDMFGTVIFRRDGVGVHASEFSGVVGPNTLGVELAFPDANSRPQEVKFGLADERGRREASRVVEPKAGQLVGATVPYSLKAGDQCMGTLTVSDIGAESPSFRVQFPIEPQQALRVSLTPYFFSGRLGIEADAAYAGIADAADNRLAVQITKAGSPAVLTQGVVGRSKKNYYGRGELSIKDLTPGGYTLAACIESGRGEKLQRTEVPLTIPEKPEWHDSTAGISDAVIPPWTPLEVDGTTVKCWGREYRFDASPLPAQITSAGEEMLQAPGAVRLFAGGAEKRWTTGPVRVTEAKANRVILASHADSDLLSLNAQTAIEYDGMITIECIFTPKAGAAVDRLAFEIPMKQERAIYFNAPYATRFASATDYKGAIDRDGWEWKRRFIPSLSLRDDDRGLDWACESDQGWLPYDRPDTLRVSRKDGRVTLEVNLLGRTTLTKPLKVTMFLEATPVRPFAFKGWRTLNIVHFMGGPEKDDEVWEIEGFGKTTYPIRGMRQARDMGARTLVFHENWSYGYGRPVPFKPDDFKRVVEYAHKLGMKVVVYYGAGLWPESPECKLYAPEWETVPMEPVKVAVPGRSDQTYVGWCGRGPQLVNYMAYGLKDIVARYDVDGIYIDGGDAFPCSNLAHGCGYVDETAGEVRPTFNVLGPREMRKRFQTVLRESGKFTLLDQHLPYGQTAQIHAFTDTLLAGEPLAHSLWSMPEYRIPLEMMREQFTGDQMGTPAEVLVYNDKLLNKYLAYSLIHGTLPRVLGNDYIYIQGNTLLPVVSRVWKAFGDFGAEEAAWLPYWKNAHVVQTQPETVKVSLYQRSDRGVLLIAGNVGAGEAEATVQLDLKRLGLPGEGLECFDPTGWRNEARLEGGTLKFKLPAETPQLLWLRQKGKAD